ncbi:[acyl-carrier-protein] S-malonyltransferase [Litorimonas taeanensis]|uniref:Malonyl CoA-acyl carrier protein transacylase n=1 Tax=Litorimonas taeanensis TaxID=568099 RepID=A0A420WIE6_9PROT|nr:ACP S-malonyltransferase [Litorimonas taeanensis]RKQ70778.1 [acyl-carrier-protein] S-malonyltransferase [Litorimonas taeanensis]
MSFAFIFPGQGSQSVGMGKALAEAFPVARQVFEEVDDALDQKLSQIMFEGPIEDLTLTTNTQPALMACSMAAMAVLAQEFGFQPKDQAFLAGHSLGEYSALCAAGSLTLADTARLLRIRGDAMQAAVPVGAGAMAALLGASVEQAEAAAEAGSKHGICQIANDNATGQIVLSGEKDAVEAAVEACADLSIKKAMMLNVSAPFHCDMMMPAAAAMREALAHQTILPPSVPIVNNVTARPVTDPDQLREDLVAQVTGRVRWRESIEWMAANGVETFAEPGCGKVLTVMLRRIVKGVEGAALNTPEALETFAKSIKG